MGVPRLKIPVEAVRLYMYLASLVDGLELNQEDLEDSLGYETKLVEDMTAILTDEDLIFISGDDNGILTVYIGDTNTSATSLAIGVENMV